MMKTDIDRNLPRPSHLYKVEGKEKKTGKSVDYYVFAENEDAARLLFETNEYIDVDMQTLQFRNIDHK